MSDIYKSEDTPAEIERSYLEDTPAIVDVDREPMRCARCGKPAAGVDCCGRGQCEYHLGWEEV